MSMGTYYDSARLLFGRAGPNAALVGQQPGDASVTYGTALADAEGSGGSYSVEAHLDSSAEGTSVRLSVDAPVDGGDRLKVVTQGGLTFAVALSATVRRQEADREAAAEAKRVADEAKSAIDGFKATADQIVYDKDLTDALEQFSRTMSATYTSTEQLDARLKEYSTVEQTAEAVKSTVSAEYIDGKVGKTYATKSEVSQTADGLETKISAKAGKDEVATMVRATTSGVEVGQVDGKGAHTTPYCTVSSAGAFEVSSAKGVPMFRASAGRTEKRQHTSSPLSASDSSLTTDPTLALAGVELLMSSSGGVSSGTVRLGLGGYSISDYMFLEFVYTDGTRSYAQRLYQPALNATTSLSRTVSDGAALYSASVTVKVDAAGALTLSNNVQLYVSPSGVTTSDSALKLMKVLGWA